MWMEDDDNATSKGVGPSAAEVLAVAGVVACQQTAP